MGGREGGQALGVPHLQVVAVGDVEEVAVQLGLLLLVGLGAGIFCLQLGEGWGGGGRRNNTVQASAELAYKCLVLVTCIESNKLVSSI